MRSFVAYVVDRDKDGGLIHGLVERPLSDLGSEGVLIQVQFSSLNYKDALVSRGNPALVKTWPHVPGIDAAGVVVGEEDAGPVLVTGFGLGVEAWGGFGNYVRVPRTWVLPVPEGLTVSETMVLGTAGLTAALAIHALLECGIDPRKGEVLVTGATGGVGSIAIMLLSQLGFRVVAWTRKTAEEPYLLALGAARVLSAEGEGEDVKRALRTPRWQAAVDTVGGVVLAHVLKEIVYGGAVAACGMAGGTELDSSVFPFILRGVRLLGIDSVQCPLPRRKEMWRRLAGELRPRDFALLHRSLTRSELDPVIDAMLQGRHARRALVRVADAL